MTKKKERPPVETFVVEFAFYQSDGRVVQASTRIARPVTDTAILKAALTWRRANPGVLPRGLGLCSTGDYGGVFISRDRQVGRFLIVPGSNRVEKVA